MKLNYYTYTVKFTNNGITHNICIKDIIDLFCKYETNENVIEKVNSDTGKKLYFVSADTHDSIYYLMTPTVLKNYRSLDKTTGKVKSLSEILGEDSLEKVAYIYIDPILALIGISTTSGGATNEDVKYYFNKLLNHLSSGIDYDLQLVPLKSGISKSDVKKLSLISKATIHLDSASTKSGVLSGFFKDGALSDDLQIEINIKRKSHSRQSIHTEISPLLDTISGDQADKAFAEVYLRGKQNTLQENVKDYLLDQTAIVHDLINTQLSKIPEEQIRDKRYANGEVDALVANYFEQFGSRILNNANCPEWSKLFKKASYDRA
jgi:hypothetical protein